MKFILPIILIVIAIGSFLAVTNPMYKSVGLLRQDMASYNEALANATALRSVRDRLNETYSGFSPSDLAKLEKMLPDSVDNIRLVLEINTIANQHQLSLKNIKYDVAQKETTGTADRTKAPAKPYQAFEIAFSTEGTYENFLLFLKDIEKNLRIIDISTISFAVVDGQAGTVPTGVYRYDFKIKTYWLK